MDELIIKGKPSALIGIVLKSGNKGDIAPISTIGRYFLKDDVNDPNTMFVKNSLDGFMANIIYPLFISQFSLKNLPENFFIHSVKIELFNDESKNTISFNQYAKIRATVKTNIPHAIKRNDPIYDADIKELHSLSTINKDPNSAIILLVSLHGEWYGMYDFTYNRSIAHKKYDTSISHINSALGNFKDLNYVPFYNDVWSAFELLAETVSLLLPKSDLQPNHKKIKKSLESFCELHELPYYNDYVTIFEIRNDTRYGRDSPHDIKSNTFKHLSSLLGFAQYVKEYLSNKMVIPSNSEDIDVNKLQKK